MLTQEYLALIELIEQRTGLRTDETRQADIARTVDGLLLAEGLLDVDSLRLALCQRPIGHPLWRAVIRATTIGETYFFRNMAQFQALREQVLPELIARRRASGFKQIRMWSAGCATGEEPYTLAILLREMLPDLADWSLTILATDINQEFLERAQTGIYRAAAFRNETPADLRDRYFTPVDGGWQLDPAIRRMVTFGHLNLVSGEFPSYETNTTGLDLIVCRNVTIYFSEATTRAIVGRFASALTGDGWLLVGHAEPLASIYETQGFAPRNFENAIFYRRVPEGTPVDSAAEWPPRIKADPLWPSPATVSSAPPDASSRPAVSSRPATPPLARPAPRPAVASRPAVSSRPPVSSRSTGTTGHLRPAGPDSRSASTDPEAPAAPVAGPGDPMQQAKQAADRGEWQAALDFLVAAARQDALAPQVHYLRALVQLQMNNADAALLSLRQAVYCEPRFGLAHYSLGELYERQGDLRAAARHWRLAEQALSGSAPEEAVLYSEDLTVEMLRGLLVHRQARLPAWAYTPANRPAGGH